MMIFKGPTGRWAVILSSIILICTSFSLNLSMKSKQFLRQRLQFEIHNLNKYCIRFKSWCITNWSALYISRNNLKSLLLCVLSLNLLLHVNCVIGNAFLGNFTDIIKNMDASILLCFKNERSVSMIIRWRLLKGHDI